MEDGSPVQVWSSDLVPAVQYIFSYLPHSNDYLGFFLSSTIFSCIINEKYGKWTMAFTTMHTINMLLVLPTVALWILASAMILLYSHIFVNILFHRLSSVQSCITLLVGGTYEIQDTKILMQEDYIYSYWLW